MTLPQHHATPALVGVEMGKPVYPVVGNMQYEVEGSPSGSNGSYGDPMLPAGDPMLPTSTGVMRVGSRKVPKLASQEPLGAVREYDSPSAF